MLTISRRPKTRDQSITYYWGLPAPAMISSVVLTCSGPGASTLSFTPAYTQHTFSNLTNGSNYVTSIQAYSLSETLVATEYYNTVQPGQLPAAPENVAFTQIGNQIQVTWGAPLSDGGSEIRWYGLFTADKSYKFGIEPWKREYVSDPIAPGTYQFVFRAINDIGYGNTAVGGTFTFS